MKIEKTISYFSSVGKENTYDCAEIAVKRAKELNLTDVVVASCSGWTARIFQKACKAENIHLVVVTHAVGFSSPGIWEFDEECARELRADGVTMVTGTHALSGLERAISRNPRLGGVSRTEVIAETLRRTVSVGTKVAVECVLIAADNGAIPLTRDVVAVGGTEEGADSVVVITPAHTASFFDLHIREFVALPGGV